jgi:ornithine cyclodeaminase/alanine dehydrogenase-like protein (mu-crystallin family)
MNNQLYTTVISAKSVQRIIQEVGMDEIMDELIERTYHVFVEYNDQDSIMPIRSGFNYETPVVGLIEWMPIRDVSQEEIIMKMVAYHPQNPKEYQLPTILSTIAKYDTRTGHLKAIMDGVLPTALRTGAASAVASKLFGNPQSKILGLIGCGAQSITQLHALSRVYQFDTVLFYDNDDSTLDSFQDRVKLLNLDTKFQKSSIKQIVESADILCTATSIGIGAGPLFEFTSTKDWLHVNAVGSDFKGKIELPKELLAQSYVSPDLLEQAVIEGECQQLDSNQIGQDIISCLKVANQLEHLKSERTVFDSTGMALQDQIVADLFLDYATAMGIGEHIYLENTSLEEKNPYSFLMKLKHKATDNQ